MEKRNKEVRDFIKKSGVRQWLIAEHLQISEITLCRWLRQELQPEKKKQILSAIKELRKVVN
jgi:DNA-binding transcriptional regulator LsrR (DeoR family)